MSNSGFVPFAIDTLIFWCSPLHIYEFFFYLSPTIKMLSPPPLSQPNRKKNNFVVIDFHTQDRTFDLFWSPHFFGLGKCIVSRTNKVSSELESCTTQIKSEPGSHLDSTWLLSHHRRLILVKPSGHWIPPPSQPISNSSAHTIIFNRPDANASRPKK